MAMAMATPGESFSLGLKKRISHKNSYISIKIIRDTETLVALTYSMTNRCEAIIAADGDATKY